MTSAEKKVLADELFALAYQAEQGTICMESIIAQLWIIGNGLRNENREDATK